MKNSFILFVLLLIIASCSSRKQKSDAYGNFEATDIIISAQVNGSLLELNIQEGQSFEQGTVVGLIDTQLLYLQKEQVLAQKKAIASQFKNIIAQIEVLDEQKNILEIEKERMENLLKDSAATDQQLDNIVGEIAVVDKQINVIEVQNSTVLSEIKAYELQIDQLNDQIKKSLIKVPIKSTIMEKYAEQYEIATLGKPLFKIADLDDMKLTVYVQGKQLYEITLGQKVDVLIDVGEDELKTYVGEVIWISDEAEFTPKIIQTREERVNLVYAVKILVKNDGKIKIGMPGEVNFNANS